MSNESENKRIDLNKYFNMPIGGIFGVTFDQMFKDVIRHEGGGVTTQPLNLSLAQMEAIKDLPNLIDELKRCYEEIDKWTEYATYVENVNMDCHQDACAEAGFLWKCTDCGAHFELPEDGIYECEFGCDASE